jgi:hypothetical protein
VLHSAHSITRAQSRRAGFEGSIEELVSRSFSSKGPIERQLVKEEEWKRRLARDKTSWWDTAAMGVATGRLTDTPPDSVASQSEGKLRTLARGRNHARIELGHVQEWREAAFDSFLGGGAGSSSEPKQAHKPIPQYSPGHFDRKYGGRGNRLPPLSRAQQKNVAKQVGAATSRETRNVEARKAVFGGGVVKKRVSLSA